VGVRVKVWVIVGVWVNVAVIVGDGSGVTISVASGAASTVPPQAVKNTDNTKTKRINCFIRFQRGLLV